jgi:alanyl-tRNA synthetase
VARSGQLGLVKLLGEASIGSGVRRVEALVGLDAFRFLARESLLVSQLSEQFKTPREQLPERLNTMVTRLRDAERELQRLRAAQLLQDAAGIAASAEDISGMAFVAHRAPDGAEADDLRKLALDVRGRVQRGRPAAVMIVGRPADRPVVVIAVNEAGRGFGLSAGTLVGIAAKALGGGGGGKPDVAQGGGAPITDGNEAALDTAFDAVRDALRDTLRSGR